MSEESQEIAPKSVVEDPVKSSSFIESTDSKIAAVAMMISPPVTKLTDSNTLHDRILKVGNTMFYVQTGLLSTYSETFHGLFSSKMKESKQSEIKLSDIDPNELEQFLLTMYPDQHQITEENILFMIRLSYYFLAPWVMKKCNDFIVQNFDSIGHLKAALLDLASAHQITTLQEKLLVDSCTNLATNGSSPVDLLECAIKHGLPTLKDKAILCVCEDVERFREEFLRLLAISFDHDIPELKVSIRTDIFHHVKISPPGGSSVSINLFLANNLPQILKQPLEIMEFILRSVTTKS